jgi:hypothetical protein
MEISTLINGYNRRGYIEIDLRYTKNSITIRNKEYLHRLVALMFIPNPYNKPQIDHIDTNSLNNHVSNLRWTTQKENMNNINSKNKISRPVQQIDHDNNVIRTYSSIKEAETYMRETTGKYIHIHPVCHGKKYYNTAGGYKWKFLDRE